MQTTLLSTGSLLSNLTDVYFLIQGTASIVPPNRIEHQVSSLATLGPAAPLHTAEPQQFSIYAKSNCVLLRVPLKDYTEIMQSYRQFVHREHLLHFIESNVPGAKAMGRLGRHRILELMTHTKFKAGHVLVKEGGFTQYIYLICSGECLLSSQHKTGLPPSFATSFDNLQYSVATRGQWIGEVAVLRNSPLMFTAIAKTELEVLRISARTFLEDFPKSSLQAIAEVIQEKVEMWKDRQHTVNGVISKLSREEVEYIRTAKFTQRQFPLASKAAQSSLRKLTLKQHGYDSTLLLNSPMFTKSKQAERKTRKQFITVESREKLPARSLTPVKVILPSASTIFSQLRPVYTASKYTNRRVLRPATPNN